jgi:hypothetical protein
MANPVLRTVLERYLHGVISRNNDRVIRSGIEQGVELLRAGAGS